MISPKARVGHRIVRPCPISQSESPVPRLAGGGDSVFDGLDFGVLEAEELGDSASEVAFDFRKRTVGIDDAPDRLHEAQALVAREVLPKELRELEEVYAFAALIFGEAEDVLELILRNVHFVPDVAGDARFFFGLKDVVGVRDLEEQGAGRHGHRVGTRRFVGLRGFRGEERADRLYSHRRESNAGSVNPSSGLHANLSKAKDLLFDVAAGADSSSLRSSE